MKGAWDRISAQFPSSIQSESTHSAEEWSLSVFIFWIYSVWCVWINIKSAFTSVLHFTAVAVSGCATFNNFSLLGYFIYNTASLSRIIIIISYICGIAVVFHEFRKSALFPALWQCTFQLIQGFRSWEVGDFFHPMKEHLILQFMRNIQILN